MTIYNRNQQIDFFRGIALILVFLTHFFQGTSLRYYFDYGRFGVQIFFFLSAYIIYSIIIDRKRYLKWSHFIKRRLVRIMVPLLIIAPFYHYNFELQKLDYSRLLNESFFTFILYENVHLTKIPGLWSISSELFFYALAPALIYLSLNNTRFQFYKMAVAFLVVQVIFHEFIDKNNWTLGAGLFERYGIFTSIIFFCMSLSEITNEPKKGIIIWFTVAILILFTTGVDVEILQYNLFLILLPIILNVLIFKHRRTTFSNRGVNYIGKYSYELYLSHFIVINSLSEIAMLGTLPFPALLATCFAISLVVAVSIAHISKLIYFMFTCIVKYSKKY